MSTMIQRLLTVVSHLGVLVVEEVVFQGSAQLWRELIASGNNEERRHVVAHVLIRHIVLDFFSHLVASSCCQRFQCGLIAHLLSHALDVDLLSHHRDVQRLGVVLRVELCTELIAGGDGERSLMVVDADDRCKAPCTLGDIELQIHQLLTSQLLLGGGIDEATVIAVVVVGAQADGSREIVVDLTGDVDLSTVDILLTLHLRVDVIHLRGDDGTLGIGHVGSNRLLEDLTHRHDVEHGDTLFVFHETTAAYDTYHRREGPIVLLIRGKECRHNGC